MEEWLVFLREEWRSGSGGMGEPQDLVSQSSLEWPRGRICGTLLDLTGLRGRV